MDVREVLAARHSSRAYKQAAVPRDVLVRIVEAATRAPSWGNTQPWEIFIAAGETMNAIRAAFLGNMRTRSRRIRSTARSRPGLSTSSSGIRKG